MRYLFVLMFLLTGCANMQNKDDITNCQVVDTKIIEVPVYTDLPVVNVKRPVLTAAAADQSKPDELVKALEVDLTNLNEYTKNLEKVLGIYKGN